MPSSASSSALLSSSAGWSRAEEVVHSLGSMDSAERLKALRDVKNQIIGNRTKKMCYIKLGAVPRVVDVLASDSEVDLLVQSAAAVGSFACGIDAGVQAVIDCGALPHLLRMLINPNQQVVEASARSLKMIFQSALAPKSDMLQSQRIDLLVNLLKNPNEIVAEVAASVIARCCETNAQQEDLLNAGVFDILIEHLGCSLKRRESSLDALRVLIKENPQISKKLISAKQGFALTTIIRFTKDKSPRTRLLACMCLINIFNSSPFYQHEWEVKTTMLPILVKLLDEPGNVGEEAPDVLAQLIAKNEELQKLAYDLNAIDNLCKILHRDILETKQLEGVFVALAELCSRLEKCRRKALSLQIESKVASALGRDCMGVRVAACSFIKSISRSVKILRTSLEDGTIVIPLLNLLDDDLPSVQVAALSAISNLVLDFTPHKSTLLSSGAATKLIKLAKSMDSSLRKNAVWALRNLIYFTDISVKEKVVEQLTTTILLSLVHDPEEDVQIQALAFVRNLVHGDIESVWHIFNEMSLFPSLVQKLCVTESSEVCTQGLYVLSNIAAGSSFFKDEVLKYVSSSTMEHGIPLIRFLQDSNNSQLRVAAAWCITNLCYPNSPGVDYRIEKLKEAGILLQLQKMTNDQCVDVRDRVRTALAQFATLGLSL